MSLCLANGGLEVQAIISTMSFMTERDQHPLDRNQPDFTNSRKFRNTGRSFEIATFSLVNYSVISSSLRFRGQRRARFITPLPNPNPYFKSNTPYQEYVKLRHDRLNRFKSNYSYTKYRLNPSYSSIPTFFYLFCFKPPFAKSPQPRLGRENLTLK